ncbi:hypothetical protein B0O44_111116 [Pedobacter nutrimenti]|jgi:uncharacterized integral membrane protein|uniref:Uncharacterized protein n=2 Tax=Pedobacter nutrimenti TaxID=1241337 RepID=A0A318UKR1_9SPHI|nr:hypothetical protein B0O44_111116 [Pedobacter nutrimenti]
MKTKTIFIIIFTALFTIFLMSNRDSVEFSFIFFKQDISKLLVVGIFTFIGFILGYWAGRPRTVISTYDNKFDDAVSTDRKNTLSDEDKDYIS